MQTTKHKKIFSNDDTLLKVIDFPRSVSGSDLTQTSDHEFHFDKCEKQIIAKDFLTENIIVELKTDKLETCLKVFIFQMLLIF